MVAVSAGSLSTLSIASAVRIDVWQAAAAAPAAAPPSPAGQQEQEQEQEQQEDEGAIGLEAATAEGWDELQAKRAKQKASRSWLG